jgi:hypothetical protein
VAEFCYRAYGLTVRSTIPLPELAPGTGPADVEIVLGDVPPRTGRRGGPNVSGTDDSLYFGPPERAAFWVHAGRRIVVQPGAGVDLATVCPFIVGSAMAAVLHQRSFLPLHASVVAVDDGCVAFLGDKGSGKSTTAAFLATQGRVVIADDICAIAFPHGQPLVWPNYQRQRLCDDVVAHLGASDSSAFRLVTGKLAVALSDTAGDAPRTLHALFVLTDAPVIATQRLDNVTALHALLTHTFRPRYITALGAERAHLERCVQLLAATPVYSLTRPRELARLPELNQVLNECLRPATPHSSMSRRVSDCAR